MSKRIILIVLTAIMGLALLLSGCAKTPAEKAVDELEDILDQANGDYTDEDFADDIADLVDTPSDSDQSSPTGQTPGESFGRFIDAKGEGYDSLSDRVGDNEMLGMTAGMELLAMAMVDLETVALTLVTDDIAANEAAGEFLGMNGMKITYSGENFSLSYTGATDEAYAAQGKYDAKTDSLTCVWTKDGNETLMLEYTLYKDGYAGQYFITAEDGQTSVIKVITNGADIGVGMGDVTDRPSSIYKSAPSDFSFISGLPSMFIIQDGQGTSTMDGVETLF